MHIPRYITMTEDNYATQPEVMSINGLNSVKNNIEERI